jgi:uncharacterized iron-regulated membrane protein
MGLVFRQFHRWVGTVVAIFLVIIAASGVTLQIEMMLTQGGGGSPGAGAPATYTDAQLLDMVRTTLAAAHRADPSSPPMQVQLELGPHPVGTVTLMAATPQRHGFNALTGQVVGGGDEGGRSLHLFLLRLHRGDLIGKPGLWLSIGCGTGLFVLCLTGAWVYIDLLRRRWGRGLAGFFWK